MWVYFIPYIYSHCARGLFASILPHCLPVPPLNFYPYPLAFCCYSATFPISLDTCFFRQFQFSFAFRTSSCSGLRSPFSLPLPAGEASSSFPSIGPRPLGASTPFVLFGQNLILLFEVQRTCLLIHNNHRVVIHN